MGHRFGGVREARLFVVAVLLALIGLWAVPNARAAGPDLYSAPEWWPLRGSHIVGCTNGNGCEFAGVHGYHGYWAIDVEATRDTQIYAAGAGQVEVAVGDQAGNCDFLLYGQDSNCPDGSRGNFVRIKHDATASVTTYYLHLSRVFVRAGDWVDENTPLGLAGDSGLAAPGYVHLHFEVRHGLFGIDPVPLKACHGGQLKSYPGEIEGKTSWSQVTAHRYEVRSDGTACALGTTTTQGGATTTTVAGGTTTTSTGSTTTTVAGDTPTLTGSAFGYSVPRLTLFGGVPNGVPIAPTPRVALAADASNSPQTARAGSGAAVFGPATIFSSGAITVRTEGSMESVTSSAEVQNVNASRTEVFTATRITSTCTASASGVNGSTTIAGGMLQTSLGDRDLVGDEVYVTLPSNPAPNTELEGRVESVGDTFRYVFNEQVRNGNGSLTVYAAHLRLLGPTAIGDVYIGRVDCGVPAPAATTTSSPLPTDVSAQVCGVLEQLRSLPFVSLFVQVLQPLRPLFGCGP